MILFDNDIRRAREAGEVVIEPFVDAHLGPNSYDVRLAKDLYVYSRAIDKSFPLDMRANNKVERVAIPRQGLVLNPGVLYLGSTVETIGTTDSYVPNIEGRSSVGRLGIAVHITAGFGDVGFVGRWTMEITVVHPVRVYAGVRIAQAYFLKGMTLPSKLYNGKYAGETCAVPSRMYADKR